MNNLVTPKDVSTNRNHETNLPQFPNRMNSRYKDFSTLLQDLRHL
jgi:hypothetical protein